MEKFIKANENLSKEELIKKSIKKATEIKNQFLSFIEENNLSVDKDGVDQVIHLLTINVLVADKKIDDDEYEIYTRINESLKIEYFSRTILANLIETGKLDADQIIELLRSFISYGAIKEDDIVEFIVMISLINGNFAQAERDIVEQIINGPQERKSSNASSSSGTVSGGRPVELEIEEKGATFKDDGDGDYEFSIGVKINNPNAGHIAKNVTVKIIIEDSNGRVVRSETERIDYIDPGSSFFFGEEYRIDRGSPDSFKVLISTDSFEPLSKRIMDGLDLENFSIDTGRWGGCTISGNITNNYNKKIRYATIHLVPKDANGKIMGGASTTVHDLFPNQTDGFECSFSVNVDHAKTVSYSCDFDVRELLD
jgi:hypothetical protein